MWRIIKYEALGAKGLLISTASILVMFNLVDYLQVWNSIGFNGTTNMSIIIFVVMFGWLQTSSKENRYQGYTILPVSLFKIALARTLFLIAGFFVLTLFVAANNFFIMHVEGITSQQLVSIGLYAIMIIGWTIVIDVTSLAKFEKQLLNKIIAYILSILGLIIIEAASMWAMIFIGKENFVFSSALIALQVLLLMFISTWAFMRRKEFVK